MKPVAIIDFEASCLPEDAASYPIEVALATIDGKSQSWLIRPHPSWRHWDWSRDAERLHGISRDLLQTDGMDACQVLHELTQAAAGHDVYADCDLDAFWLETLCMACREPLPFPIRYLGELMQDCGATRAQVVAALERAAMQLPREHVARDDARRLALAMRCLIPTADAARAVRSTAYRGA